MLPRILFYLTVLSGGLLVAFAPLPFQEAAPQERIFRVEARQFAYSPSELRVNPGDIMTIQLVSTDVVHGLYVDGYGISVQADPGQTKSLSFVANKPGAFRLRCNVTCGAMHPFMNGRLEIGSNDWLTRSVGFIALAAITIVWRPRSINPRPGVK
ncbi:MAG TPA: cupredoxin domain-containing protein [Anaerolineales bacterium]